MCGSAALKLLNLCSHLKASSLHGRGCFNELYIVIKKTNSDFIQYFRVVYGYSECQKGNNPACPDNLDSQNKQSQQ